VQPRADPDRRRGRGHSRVGGQERSGPCRSAVVLISAAIPRAQASMSVRSRKSPPVRGVQAGRAMALGGRQPDVSGRAAASAETRSGAAIGRRCDEDLERVVASRSRLGRADLACPDDRLDPARRNVRAAVVARRPGRRRADLAPVDRPTRRPGLGEGHQAPPAAARRARSRDGRGAHRALGSLCGPGILYRCRARAGGLRVLTGAGQPNAPGTVRQAINATLHSPRLYNPTELEVRSGAPVERRRRCPRRWRSTATRASRTPARCWRGSNQRVLARLEDVRPPSR